MMEKQILLPAAVRKEMMAEFKSYRSEMVRALNYAINSPRAQMLRAAALQRGGLIYTGNTAPAGYVPEVETTFDHAAGYMYQSLGTRVKLSLNLNTNVATVFIDDSQVARFTGMTTATWGTVLYSLQQLFNHLNS